MPPELRLTFSDPAQVSVALRGEIEGNSRSADFVSPLTEDDLKELRWYVEDYGIGYRAEPDDQRAAIVRDKLPVWGAELFAAVFQTDDEAAKLFGHFLEAKKEGRILSIAADHPAVLSLPWELLTAPGRSFLFNEQPPISIRRGLPAAKQESTPQPRTAKPVLHLLFIISRPKGTDFLNPRSDAQALLAALEQQDAVRVEMEFLRLATLAELKQRLLDSTKAPVDIIHFDGHGVLADSDSAGKEGQLLFESEWGGTKKVSGKTFGDLLNSSHTGLVVLSACQSAMMDSEDPMSGVAAQLVHAGIPAVIAMTYSTLVTTTELLFAAFYRSLFKGRTVARSLNEARHTLCCKPERGTRLRGAYNAQEVTLKLHDWFLPALYQSGADQPLLSAAADESLPPKAEPLHNLPDVQKSGFFGRSWELWQIERFFAVNHCRRISITGFGGQGKTALACEAGRWLLRTRLFQRACLVRFDSYQGSDPVGLAVSTMSAVFQESLLDAAAAQASLERTPTLLILDNLETLAESGALAELLDAAAKWSEAGESRVLLTSRQPDFQHPSYPPASKQEHRHIALQGLRENDAVDWFDAIYRLPPEAKQPRPQRDVLVRLFGKVGFHPLSISLLAQQLKEHRPAELGERLEALLEAQPADREDRSLLASLELSIERLPEQCRKWLPRLGVFQGGCFEEMIGRVTGLVETDESLGIAEGRKLWEAMQSGDPIAIIRAAGHDLPEGELPPEMVQQLQELVHDEELQQLGKLVEATSKSELIAGADQSSWLELREALLQTGLMEAKCILEADKTFLRFHPTLAPSLWQKLGKEEQDALMERYCQAYHLLSLELYKLDNTTPHAARAIARHELPNLLRAVYAALQSGRAEEGVNFAECVTFFLRAFGLRRDWQESAKAAGKVGGEVGSQVWYFSRSNLGEQLWQSGQPAAAIQVFEDTLVRLGEGPSYNRCLTLMRLGRYSKEQGQPAEAERLYRQELAELAQLEQDDGVQRQTATAWTDIADALCDQGRYTEAKETYQASLEIKGEIDDVRGRAVVTGQLGTLAYRQGQLTEAEEQYKEALVLFQDIGEPDTEAVFWHQLGLVYQDEKHWEAAEQAYRQAARLKEEQGLQGGMNRASATWDQLAQLCETTGRIAEAEQWHGKALASCRAADDQPGMTRTLNNLAKLLANDPARLDEARRLAEESLEIAESLDPTAVEIWKTYKLLARIATQQGESSWAAEYRSKSRKAYFAFPGLREVIRRFEDFMAMVVQATTKPDMREQLEQNMDKFAGGDWANMTAAIRLLLNGERDEAVLCEPLNFIGAAIIRAILEEIAGQE